ncbi:MAG: organic solvent transporter permease [Gemmatimonadetes bacterium]|jgi:phospholipid/cholesterol/gamma-HCH transport system permease protein|nr:organic solvent transporter permease [Gemmatimonadota bacterium]
MKLLQLVQAPVAAVGAKSRKSATETLDLAAFIGAGSRALGGYFPSARRYALRTLTRQLRFTIVGATPLVVALGALIGSVVIAQAQAFGIKFGLSKSLGDLLSTLIIRELGPLFTAIIVVGRSGTAIVTELATAQVLGEITALEAAGVDPMQVIVLPRIFACALGVAVLTVYFDVAALGGGLVATWWLAHLPPVDFLVSLRVAVAESDIGRVMTKALAAGAGIATISCWAGLRAGTSPAGIPQSVTRGTVRSLGYVFILAALFALGHATQK